MKYEKSKTFRIMLYSVFQWLIGRNRRFLSALNEWDLFFKLSFNNANVKFCNHRKILRLSMETTERQNKDISELINVEH